MRKKKKKKKISAASITTKVLKGIAQFQDVFLQKQKTSNKNQEAGGSVIHTRLFSLLKMKEEAMHACIFVHVYAAKDLGGSSLNC